MVSLAYALRSLGIAFTYALLGSIVQRYATNGEVITTIWPASGLALAALLVYGKQYWPAIVSGAFIASIISTNAIIVSLAIATGSTLGVLATIWLLTRFNTFNIHILRPHDFFYLVAAAGAGAGISALITIGALYLAGQPLQNSLMPSMLHWWQGEALGAIVVTPMLLTWRKRPKNWLGRNRVLETITLFSATLLVGLAPLLSWFAQLPMITNPSWGFILVIWAAVRFGMHGAMLVIGISATSILANTMLANNLPEVSASLWLHMLILTLIGVATALILKDERKLAKVKLSSQAERLAVAVDFGKIGVWEVDLNTNKVTWDDNCFALYKARKKYFAGTLEGWAKRLHPDDIEKITLAFQDKLAGANECQQTFRIVWPNGQIRHIEGHGKVIRDPKGKPLRVIGTNWDVTERKETEALARENEDRLKLAVSAADVGIWEQSLRSDNLIWDNSMLALFGIDKKDFAWSRKSWLTHIHPDDLADEAAHWANAINNQENYVSEFRIIRPDGEIRYIESHGQIIKNKAGKPTNMIGTSWDNGVYAQTEHQLQLAHTAFNKSNTAFFWMSKTCQVTDINDFACASLGYTRDELIGMHAWDFDPDFNPEEQAHVAEKIKKEKVLVFETRHQNKDGTIFPEEITANHIDLFGYEQVFCSVQNISERKAAEESTNLAASVYENSSEAMTVTDGDGVILTANPAFTKITGYTADEVVGKNRGVLSSGRHSADFFEEMWREINTTGYWQGEVWDKRKDGGIYPAWLTINTVYDKSGAVYRRIYLFSDNSAWKDNEALIWRQANFDALTQLPNRQMFHDKLEQDMKKADRSNKPLVLMFLDLDRFKEINDSLGHDIGDILLQEAAKRISSCVREVDMVARLGGDEFTIILNEFNQNNGASRIARQILNKLSAPFQLNEKLSYISASIGITTYPKDSTNIDELIKNADQAMYEAKDLGRNRYAYFTPSMQASTKYKMQMADDLRLALSEGQLFLNYQPIVQLSTGAIHKAEALIRWQHPRFGLINPAQFIPIAEHTGLIIDIGDWLFRQTIAQVKHWKELLQQDIQVSVNVSPVQFNDKSNQFPPLWKQLKKAKLSGKNILIEITESLLLKANTSTNDQLIAFRDAGIQVALDDFGTGYSSMSYLKEFDIDYIKIDQSFIQGIATNSNDMALCEAMITMAHKLNMLVVAEGVETAKQRDLLIEIGCDYAQGYLFSKPVSATDFEGLFETTLQVTN